MAGEKNKWCRGHSLLEMSTSVHGRRRDGNGVTLCEEELHKVEFNTRMPIAVELVDQLSYVLFQLLLDGIRIC